MINKKEIEKNVPMINEAERIGVKQFNAFIPHFKALTSKKICYKNVEISKNFFGVSPDGKNLFFDIQVKFTNQKGINDDLAKDFRVAILTNEGVLVDVEKPRKAKKLSYKKQLELIEKRIKFKNELTRIEFEIKVKGGF